MWNAAFGIFAAFLVLKLINVIDWSWWWVTSPLWIAGVATAAIVGTAILLSKE